MSKKYFDSETLVAAIKEVAEVIAKNGGADIKAIAKEINEGEVAVHIIVGPYRFINEEAEK